MESDYFSETLSRQPRLYRIIELHENDNFTIWTDSEQLLRENPSQKTGLSFPTETDSCLFVFYRNMTLGQSADDKKNVFCCCSRHSSRSSM